MKAEWAQNQSIGSLPVRGCLERTKESGLPRVSCLAGKSASLEEPAFRVTQRNSSCTDKTKGITAPSRPTALRWLLVATSKGPQPKLCDSGQVGGPW